MKWQMISLGVVGFFMLALSQGTAYVRTTFPNGAPVFWPDATATVDLQFGCPQDHPSPTGDRAGMTRRRTPSTAGTPLPRAFVSRGSVLPRPPILVDHTNRINTAAFSPTVCGLGFGDALAVTKVYGFSDGTLADAYVLLDAGRSWSTYPGVRQGAAYDFHRVVMHEFGHVLGLNHPDQSGQAVTALMNSRVSDIDDVQADDIAGVNAIYAASTRMEHCLKIPSQERP